MKHRYKCITAESQRGAHRYKDETHQSELERPVLQVHTKGGHPQVSR